MERQFSGLNFREHPCKGSILFFGHYIFRRFKKILQMIWSVAVYRQTFIEKQRSNDSVPKFLRVVVPASELL